MRDITHGRPEIGFPQATIVGAGVRTPGQVEVVGRAEEGEGGAELYAEAEEGVPLLQEEGGSGGGDGEEGGDGEGGEGVEGAWEGILIGGDRDEDGREWRGGEVEVEEVEVGECGEDGKLWSSLTGQE